MCKLVTDNITPNLWFGGIQRWVVVFTAPEGTLVSDVIHFIVLNKNFDVCVEFM